LNELTFEQVAAAGGIDTARGWLRNRFGNGPYPGTGAGFAELVARIRRIGPEEGSVPYEVARSIARRAITSLNGANQIRNSGNRLRPNQHGLDPSFTRFTSARYVYRTIVVCLDESSGEETRTPVDIESNDSLTRDQIEEQSLDGFSRGRTTLRGRASDYPQEGSCVSPEVLIVFAIRTR
jgi:hypothetical protein